MEAADDSTTTWATEYKHQQGLTGSREGWRVLFRPSVLGACLAIAGLIFVGPLVLLLLFTFTEYLTNVTVLIEADKSFFASPKTT